MQYLANFLTEWIEGEGGEELVRDELVNAKHELLSELNKGEAAKAANAKAYEDIKDIVFGALSATPVTIAELFTEIEKELPEGMTKSKIQYALTHLWQDEIVKIEGKPNTYRKA